MQTIAMTSVKYLINPALTATWTINSLLAKILLIQLILSYVVTSPLPLSIAVKAAETTMNPAIPAQTIDHSAQALEGDKSILTSQVRGGLTNLESDSRHTATSIEPQSEVFSTNQKVEIMKEGQIEGKTVSKEPTRTTSTYNPPTRSGSPSRTLTAIPEEGEEEGLSFEGDLYSYLTKPDNTPLDKPRLSPNRKPSYSENFARPPVQTGEKSLFRTKSGHFGSSSMVRSNSEDSARPQDWTDGPLLPKSRGASFPPRWQRSTFEKFKASWVGLVINHVFGGIANFYNKCKNALLKIRKSRAD